MKHLKLVVGILLTTGMGFAQTDEINLQKYWKLRNDFREDFIKIGSSPGEGLPARALKPMDCVDNLTSDNTGYAQTPKGRYGHGEMAFGDGMIRQGYYLGLLATEYRLLKDAGEDYSGTLNELYFALKAINRCDLTCESNIDFNYGLELDPNLNGFYLREDIPENFAFENWGNSNLEARCVDSPMYKTNNAMHLDDGVGLWADANSYQNVPSLDQLSSLMLGFSLIHKLVDANEFVMPPGEPEGYNIVTETKNIVDRMINYIEDHNWFMIDVNGWPVANGGGDCLFLSYPLHEAAERITGHDYDGIARRRISNFLLKNVQYCLTGFGLESEEDPEAHQHACMMAWAGHPDEMLLLSNAVPPGPENCQDQSRFQEWSTAIVAGSTTWDPDDGWLKDVWDFYDRYDLIEAIEDVFNANPYALNLIYNFGVASGRWDQNRLHEFIYETDNKELYLINAVLRDETPHGTASEYKAYLNQMSPNGPYNMETYVDGTVFKISSGAPNGWRDDFRWTAGDAAHTGADNTGIFNGIDYMLYHNLYRLAYKTTLPAIKVDHECFCEPSPVYPETTPTEGVTQQTYDMVMARLNSKLSFINTCVDNPFTAVGNNVTGTLNIEPYFPNYVDMNIYTGEFLTENAAVSSTGTVNVRTYFKVCNGKTLTIQNGGKLNIDKVETTVGTASVVDNSGIITVKAGTKLKLWGKLILKSTGKLIIEDGATVIVDASSAAIIEYYNGAQIIMNGPNSKLIIRGGIKIKDLADFKIIQNGTSCGKVIIDSPNVGFTADNTNATYSFTGSGKTVPYMTITKNSKLWVMNGFAKKINFTNANVVLEEGASIRCDQGFNATTSKFTSSFNNGGILFSEGSLFSGTDLLNVPVLSDFTSENTGILEAYNSTFKGDNSALTAQYLIKVIKRGYKLQNTVVQGVKDYCIYSSNLDLASSIDGSTLIGYNGTLPAGNNMIGIYDQSTVELTVKNSSIKNCNLGIQKRNGKLTVRCSGFDLNRDINIQPQDGCILNMNSAYLGGYSILKKTANNKNIYLLNSGFMDIKNGYNFIEYIPTQTIYGSVSSYCSSCPVHDVTSNQWGSSNPAPTFMGTVNAATPGITIAWVKAPTALNQLCPVGLPGEGGKNAKSGETSMLPKFYSDIEGDSLALDDAIYQATALMSYYNADSPDDIRAIERLDEVFTANFDKTDSTLNSWLWFAFGQMKAAVESSYGSNLITESDNVSQFDATTQRYVAALMYMTDSIISPDNYAKQFYHELDKAHLLRLTGHTEIGLNILEELEYCGLDSTEQAQLNYWKGLYLSDLVIQEANVSTFDTTVVVDTSEFLNPALVINAFTFGAIIDDLNSIQYPNCDFFHSKELMAKRNAKQLNVYPNPANDQVTIQVTSDVDGAGMLSFELTDGRKVHSKGVDITNNVQYSVNVSNWNPGIYLVTLTYSDGKQITKRLVVK